MNINSVSNSVASHKSKENPESTFITSKKSIFESKLNEVKNSPKFDKKQRGKSSTKKKKSNTIQEPSNLDLTDKELDEISSRIRVENQTLRINNVINNTARQPSDNFQVSHLESINYTPTTNNENNSRFQVFNAFEDLTLSGSKIEDEVMGLKENLIEDVPSREELISFIKESVEMTEKCDLVNFLKSGSNVKKDCAVSTNEVIDFSKYICKSKFQKDTKTDRLANKSPISRKKDFTPSPSFKTISPIKNHTCQKADKIKKDYSAVKGLTNTKQTKESNCTLTSKSPFRKSNMSKDLSPNKRLQCDLFKTKFSTINTNAEKIKMERQYLDKVSKVYNIVLNKGNTPMKDKLSAFSSNKKLYSEKTKSNTQKMDSSKSPSRKIINPLNLKSKKVNIHNVSADIEQPPNLIQKKIQNNKLRNDILNMTHQTSFAGRNISSRNINQDLSFTKSKYKTNRRENNISSFY